MKNLVYSLRIDNECFGPVMIAVGCRPYFAFKDGVRQSTVEGYQYTVVLPKLGYQQINVKVPGECKLEIIEGKEAHVKFDGLVVRPYVNREAMTLALTATATAVHTVGKVD